MLLYKLNYQHCQQFITRDVKYFRERDERRCSIKVSFERARWLNFTLDDLKCDRRVSEMNHGL